MIDNLRLDPSDFSWVIVILRCDENIYLFRFKKIFFLMSRKMMVMYEVNKFASDKCKLEPQFISQFPSQNVYYLINTPKTTINAHLVYSIQS